MSTAEHKRLRQSGDTSFELSGGYRLSHDKDSLMSYPDYQVKKEDIGHRRKASAEANQRPKHYWLASGQMKRMYE